MSVRIEKDKQAVLIGPSPFNRPGFEKSAVLTVVDKVNDTSASIMLDRVQFAAVVAAGQEALR